LGERFTQRFQPYRQPLVRIGECARRQLVLFYIIKLNNRESRNKNIAWQIAKLRYFWKQNVVAIDLCKLKRFLTKENRILRTDEKQLATAIAQQSTK